MLSHLTLSASSKDSGPCGLAHGVLVLLIWITGCQSSQPHASTVGTVATDDGPQYRAALSDGERRELAASMREVAGDHLPVDPPRPRATTFADIPAAVAMAAGDTEMAIMETQTADGRYRFILRTVEDWPVTLTVEKNLVNEAGYIASAEVGHFADRDERAEALIAALARRMDDISRIRRFAQESD